MDQNFLFKVTNKMHQGNTATMSFGTKLESKT